MFQNPQIFMAEMFQNPQICFFIVFWSQPSGILYCHTFYRKVTLSLQPDSFIWRNIYSYNFIRKAIYSRFSNHKDSYFHVLPPRIYKLNNNICLNNIKSLTQAKSNEEHQVRFHFKTMITTLLSSRCQSRQV